MTRTYTLKRRAAQQAETRQRIVDAAVELHASIGPAATTISMIAEQAGVQRHTVYAHFPDDRSLLMACSGLVEERDPLPDPEPWRTIADRRARLRAGLTAVYEWYARNASLLTCVLRDAEQHALVQEIAGLRFGPAIAAWHEVLGTDLGRQQRAMLHLALSFHTWRTLTRDSGLEADAAIDVMVQAIAGADAGLALTPSARERSSRRPSPPRGDR